MATTNNIEKMGQTETRLKAPIKEQISKKEKVHLMNDSYAEKLMTWAKANPGEAVLVGGIIIYSAPKVIYNVAKYGLALSAVNLATDYILPRKV